jgi:small subunit ribosomal protein S20
MANTKSAKKRARQTPKRAARNTEIRSKVKTAVRAAREAVVSNSKDLQAALLKAVSTLSKAGKQGGVLHKKAVSRKVSRLAKAANKATKKPAATK